LSISSQMVNFLCTPAAPSDSTTGSRIVPPGLLQPMLWIRIHQDPLSFGCLDPDPCWECGSGSRSKNLQINLGLSKRLFVPSNVCVKPIAYFKCVFHVKIQLFVT
jgi:hypothetical protein